MKNIQIIDGADNATFSIFQCNPEDFQVIFPAAGQDIALIDDVLSQPNAMRASEVLSRLWQQPVLKSDAHGIHGTLYYDCERFGKYLPASRREIDWDESALNEVQRILFSTAKKHFSGL